MTIEPIGEAETWDHPAIAARLNALIAAQNERAVDNALEALREEDERMRAHEAELKRVYVVVGEDMVLSGDAYTTTSWVIAVCSTEDEALRRIVKAPRAPGSRYVCSVQVWEVDGGRVS